MEVKFGTGNIEGFISQDTFSLGPLKIRGQNSERDLQCGKRRRVSHSTIFGYHGSCLSVLSAYDFTPVFDNIIAQDLLQSPCFLSISANFLYRNPLFFGAPDPSFYVGNITWVPRVKAVLLGNQT